MVNILFLDILGKNRSKRARQIVDEQYPLHTAHSAGLSFALTSKYGTQLCNETMLRAAEIVFLLDKYCLERMEQYYMDDPDPDYQLERNKIKKKLFVAHIPDDFDSNNLDHFQALTDVLE